MVDRGLRTECSLTLKRSYQTRTVLPVTRTVATPKMSVLTNEKYADVHFVYSFYDGKSVAALREHQHQYPDRSLPYRRVLEAVHRNVGETVTLRTHALAGRRGRSMLDDEDMSDVVHGNTSTTFLLQQDDFLTLCVRISLFHLRPNQGLHNRGQTSPSQFSR
jgi:hypothetical protein